MGSRRTRIYIDGEVTSKQAVCDRVGTIRTKLDVLSLTTEGDESENNLLFDGHLFIGGTSDVILR